MPKTSVTRRAVIGVAVSGAALFMLNPTEGKDMERVDGIGGFFFRAKDPKALARWYADNLGITLTPQDYNATPWRQEAGTTVFEPFKQDTTFFGDMSKQWMINFRVKNLDKMAAQLRAKDIAVEIDPETYPNGRFASLKDPEGNPIQLWQPED